MSSMTPLVAEAPAARDDSGTSIARYHNQVCPICQSAFVPNRIGRVRECEYDSTTELFDVHQCRVCDTVALDPRPSEEDLHTIYPPHYYAFDVNLNKDPRSTSTERFTQRLFRSIRLANIKNNVLRHAHPEGDRPLRVLDVGCGVGSQLDNIREVQPTAETWGVDFGADAVAKAAARGHRTVAARFEDADLPEGYFDIVYALHVIEHVGEPDEFVERALTLLRPGGVLVLATPNIDCWDFWLLKRRHWGGYHTPRHWYLFNRKSFEVLGRRLGLPVVDWTPYTLSSFWVVSCNSIARDLCGNWIANKLFPPVQIMKGGVYPLFLVCFFAALSRMLLLVTGTGNAMWVTFRKAANDG